MQVLEQEVAGFEAAAVRWEPCGSIPGLDGSGLCADCGWPEDDHGPGDAAHAGAIVIPVPRRERPRLRRAS